MIICVCGNAKKDEEEICKVCGLVYTLRTPKAQLEIEEEPPESLYVEVMVE